MDPCRPLTPGVPMRYLGGKFRLAKKIAAHVQRHNPRSYHEPFCGMFNVGQHVQAGRRSAGDTHEDLILLLTAVRDGWTGPQTVSLGDYNAYRSLPPSPVRGFVGFGCSFGGRWFQGYSRDPDKSRNYDCVVTMNRAIEKLRPNILGVDFRLQPYWEYDGDADVMYCDPPYMGATPYMTSDTKPIVFDFPRFWQWVREQSLTRVVYVSEYQAPADFEVVDSWPVKKSISLQENSNNSPATETLFRYMNGIQ